MPRKRRRAAFFAGLWAALAVLAGCAPLFLSDEAVPVRGAFLPDGSCRVEVGGVPLFGSADNARTVYVFGVGSNVTPPNQVLHEVSCVAVETMRLGNGDSATVPSESGRGLLFLLGRPPGALVAVGRYRLAEGAVLVGAPATASGAVHDPRWRDAPGRGWQPFGRLGSVHLAATAGEVVFMRVAPGRADVARGARRYNLGLGEYTDQLRADSTRLVGTFRFTARRRWGLE